jgi:hypothetical protein
MLLASFTFLDSEEVDLFHILDEDEEAILFQEKLLFVCELEK